LWHRTLIGLACGTAAVAAVVAFACIPDLPALPPTPDAPAVLGPYCGDGIIQLDAGEHCDPGDAGVVPPPGCTPSCQIDCAGFVYLDHCYYRGGDQGSLQNASIACGTDDGYVITVESQDEWAFVLDGSPFDPREPFWINLTGTDSTVGYTTFGEVDKPGWRQGICSGCFAETVDGAAPLPVLPGFPANTFDCVVGDKADPDTWFSVPCFLPLPNDAGPPIKPPHVLCERDPSGSYADPNCTSGGLCFTLPATYPAKRYTYFPGAQTWDEAEGSCAKLGGALLVVQTRDEREELWEALLKVSPVPQRIWLGLSLDASANVWVWDDGVLADEPDAYPEPWAVNRPIPQTRPGASTHAFDLDQQSAVDTQLANNGQLGTAAFVCEFRR
jgi:Lectin C-type domain